VGLVKQLRAGVEVGEGADAQAVGGVQLGLQEVAAGVPHVRQLQQAGGRQQNLIHRDREEEDAQGRRTE
jgi:hypothetical protein